MIQSTREVQRCGREIRILRDMNQAILNYKEKLDEALEEFKISEITWQTFINKGTLLTDSHLSPEIFSSWKRCRAKGVNPFQTQQPCISPGEISKRVHKSEELLHIVASVCTEIASCSSSKAIRFDYYDSDLYLIDSFGSSEHSSCNLQLGVCQSEDFGTNAVNLAKLLEEPVQVCGYEHYCAEYHNLISSAIPIHDRNGNLAAVVGINSELMPYQKYILNLLIAMRRTVKYILNEKHDFDSNLIYTELAENIKDPFVLVSGGGAILCENRAAKELLNGKYSSVDGLSIDAVWGPRNPFKEVLYSKEAITNRKTFFHVNGDTLRINGIVKPLLSHDKKLMAISGKFESTSIKKEDKVNSSLQYTFDHIIMGKSEKMLQTVRLAKEASRFDSNILILGSTGTGKELFAQAIHNSSPYADGPFVVLNCSAIPDSLFESELFGYEGGSFTGAKKEGKIGKFEAASGGSIFLDEINSMPISMQVKLLRAIQSKRITRVGGTKEIPINTRIISASNVDLWDMVQAKTFREDLFYRINVISLQLPSLKERAEDIPLFIKHIMSRMQDVIHSEIRISDGAVDLLKKYDWPGNVRELENVIERSCIIANARGSKYVETEDLLNYSAIAHTFHATDGESGSNDCKEDWSAVSERFQGLERTEAEEIYRILKKNKGNIQQSAKELGITRSTLYAKIKKYNLL